MGFSAITLAPSSTIKDMAQQAATSLADIAATVQEGAGQLASLGVPSDILGGLWEQAQKTRDAATQAIKTDVSFMAITPYQHTIGQRIGDKCLLTPDTALKTFVGRFAEATTAIGAEQKQGLLLLMAAATKPAGLAEALEAFCAVYPMTDLQKILRRAKALATLDTDKFKIPAGPGYPAWRKQNPQKDGTGKAAMQQVCSMTGLTEGAAQGELSPAGALAEFAAKQVQKIADKAQALADLLEGMQGAHDGWAGVYVEGTVAEITTKLASMGAPYDGAYQQTALLCFFGSPANLAYYRETFGLC